MDGKTLSLLHWRNWRGNQFRIGTISMARLKLFQGKAECRRSSRSAGQGLGATWKSMSVESGSHHPLAIHGRCIGRRVWKRWMDKRSGSCLLIDPLCQSLDNNRLLLCGQTTLTSFWWASLSHMLRMSLSLFLREPILWIDFYVRDKFITDTRSRTKYNEEVEQENCIN